MSFCIAVSSSASENIPVPSPPSQLELRADKICERATTSAHFEVLSESSGTDTAQNVDGFFFFLTPHLLDQRDLNDLVRDLGLTKKKSELLASRLKQWNLLQKGVKGTFYQRWSPRGRPWPRGRPRGHILKSLAWASKVKSLALASKLQVLENCPVLGSRTALFFEQLNFVGKRQKLRRKFASTFWFSSLEA